MNNRCFRLIFSKPLGFLIPVAEIATAKRKPGQQQAHSSISLPLIPPAFSLKRIALSLLLAGAPGWAAAEIILDRNFGGTSMGSAANGVPVIEIANPNGSGLSHNRFGQFDVSNPGVIFNNSLVNGTSQIGGAVLLNPNLKRTARAILTEVTGNKPSSISGTLEVFGDAADLLIANRMKKQADQTSAGSPQWAAVAEKYSRHIVLNGAGSASKRQIDAISNKHPTITTVFDVSGDGVPTYNSGKGTGGYSGGTKVYVFNGSNKPVIETPRVIKHVDEMFDGFSRVSKLKEFHQSGNDFKKGAREKFEQYFLINAESGNAVADRAVQRLTAKHPEKTTVFVPDADGNMKVVTGMPKQGGGRTKFEVVGHGQEGKIGDLSPLQIVDAVGKISSTNNAVIEKLSLVGCESECKYNGILEEVKYLLIKSDRNNVKVKGYPTPIIINEFARKQPVAPGTPGALGNDDAQASGRSGKRTPPPLSPLRL